MANGNAWERGRTRGGQSKRSHAFERRVARLRGFCRYCMSACRYGVGILAHALPSTQLLFCNFVGRHPILLLPACQPASYHRKFGRNIGTAKVVPGPRAKRKLSNFFLPPGQARRARRARGPLSCDVDAHTPTSILVAGLRFDPIVLDVDGLSSPLFDSSHLPFLV